MWAVTYAQSIGVPGALAYAADKAALSLRALGIDNDNRAPEYDLARANFLLERNEFDPWYRVAYRMSRQFKGPYEAPNDDACALAYDHYQQLRLNFF